MSLKYIRNYYQVPASRGGIILYTGQNKSAVRMRIIGSRGAHLKCRQISDGPSGIIKILHPTWGVEYLPTTKTERDKG